MALLASGKRLIRALEDAGAIAVKAPLEGGFEGRYQRRIRTAGYECLHITARGLGDLSAYLMGIHGVRPPHLGKKNMGQSAAVGDRHYIPPMVGTRLDALQPKAKGLLIWLIEGQILSKQELQYLAALPQLDTRIKVVVEVGGDRVFSWQ
ncbi:MAG: NAD(P)H-quinone oxidoreductase subunit N, partial [Cyanobacteria bacterium J06639_16]